MKYKKKTISEVKLQRTSGHIQPWPEENHEWSGNVAVREGERLPVRSIPVHWTDSCACVSLLILQRRRAMFHWNQEVGSLVFKAWQASSYFNLPRNQTNSLLCAVHFKRNSDRNLSLQHMLWGENSYYVLDGEVFRTVIRRLTTGIRSEKCVIGDFVVVRTCTYTNLDSTV